MFEFDQYMEKVKKVSGYIGSAILNYSGETLYIDATSTGNDIAYSASVFNDAFRQISEASLDIGFSEASFLETATKDGYVFVVSVHEKGELKLTFFTIFADNGNIPLGKMMIDKAAPAVLTELEQA